MATRDPVTGRFMKARKAQKKAAVCNCAKAAKKTTSKKAIKPAKKVQKKGKKA